MIFNKKYSQKLAAAYLALSAIILSACQPLPFLKQTPAATPQNLTTSSWVAPSTTPQEKIIQLEPLLQSQQNFTTAIGTLKENQFTCESFENGLSAKMTRCQKEYNDLQSRKVCNDTIWLEHQNNTIKKSQKFFDCQQVLF